MNRPCFFFHKVVINHISLRMLRELSSVHKNKPVSVDNLQDMKAMMSPRLNVASRKLKHLEKNLFELLQFKDPYLQLKRKYWTL